MAEILLAAALAACSQDSTTCSHMELESGKNVITVCDVAPEREGRPITLNTFLHGKQYVITLEPECVRL